MNKAVGGYRQGMASTNTGGTAGFGGSARFLRTDLAADAVVAAHFRREFGMWLRRHLMLDEDRFSDVLLAVNEAFANAAEYAYLPESRSGTVDVLATLGSESDALTVTVADHGKWRDPAPSRSQRHGRGIPLMRALADSAFIDGTAHGTKVTMTWRNVTPFEGPNTALPRP